MSLLKSFLADESEATAVEYGLIAALGGVVVVQALTSMGTHSRTTFKRFRPIFNRNCSVRFRAIGMSGAQTEGPSSPGRIAHSGLFRRPAPAAKVGS
jgi:pilus assembly protein Flp/PilA